MNGVGDGHNFPSPSGHSGQRGMASHHLRKVEPKAVTGHATHGLRVSIANGASPQPDEHAMMPPNQRRDLAWSKAHHHGTTSRTSCDQTLAPGLGTQPYKATAVSRIELDYAESKYFQGPHFATRENTALHHLTTQNLTHLHQLSHFKISSHLHALHLLFVALAASTIPRPRRWHIGTPDRPPDSELLGSL